GAIVVTFLFVLMLAQQVGLSDADARSREPLLASVTGILLLGTLLYVLQRSYGTDDVDQLLRRTASAASQSSKESIAEAVGKEDALFKDYKDLCAVRGWGDLLSQVKTIHEGKWLTAPDENEMKYALAELSVVGQRARNRLGCLQPSGNAALSD